MCEVSLLGLYVVSHLNLSCHAFKKQMVSFWFLSRPVQFAAMRNERLAVRFLLTTCVKFVCEKIFKYMDNTVNTFWLEERKSLLDLKKKKKGLQFVNNFGLFNFFCPDLFVNSLLNV